MKMQHILIPVDFSEYSDRAVRYGIFLAEQLIAKVTLFHAITLFQEDIGEEVHLEEYEKLLKLREEVTRKKLKRHNDKAAARGVEIHSEIRRGISAADAILEYLEEHQFDLIVIGTHGRGGIKKWIYGSVAEKVVRMSPIPVITVHHLPDQLALKKILVPIDFSEHSREAIEYARFFATHFQAEVEFLHVLEREFHPAYYTAEVDSLFELDPELKDRALQRLREFVGTEDGFSFTIVEGRAYQEIVQRIKDTGVDLTIMATRGLSGVEHLLIGSTTERVVRLAERPVLTVSRKRA